MYQVTQLFLMLGCVLLVLCIILPIFFGATPVGRAAWDEWFHDARTMDDVTECDARDQADENVPVDVGRRLEIIE